MKRRFLAVVPDGLELRADLTALVAKLKRTMRERDVGMRWVPPSLWHVTLAFLGAHEGSLDFLHNGQLVRLHSIVLQTITIQTIVYINSPPLGALP